MTKEQLYAVLICALFSLFGYVHKHECNSMVAILVSEQFSVLRLFIQVISLIYGKRVFVRTASSVWFIYKYWVIGYLVVNFISEFRHVLFFCNAYTGLCASGSCWFIARVLFRLHDCSVQSVPLMHRQVRFIDSFSRYASKEHGGVSEHFYRTLRGEVCQGAM